MLVNSEWIERHPEARVVDLRWPKGREKYEQGHIPGAAFVDLDRDLSSPVGPGRHPLPPPEQFAKVLSRLGIGPETPVVIYDDAGGSIAGRLWFMLRAIGHRDASLLDGGLKAWTGPLTSEEPRIEPAPLRSVKFD